MILGTVGPDMLGRIILRIATNNGEVEPTLVVVDTGFNGSLGLTQDTLNKVSNYRSGTSRLLFANGSVEDRNEYIVSVIWNNTPLFVPAVEMAYDVIGAELMFGNRLTMDFRENGLIDVSELSSKSVATAMPSRLPHTAL